MRCLRVVAVAFACVWSTTAVLGQSYPNRTITFISNYPPGGAVDITARIVAEKLSKIFGQSIVVENRPGGTGAIGAGAVSRAEPDEAGVMVVETPGEAERLKARVGIAEDAAEFVIHEREFHSEGGGLSVNAVAAADLRSQLMFDRAFGD